MREPTMSQPEQSKGDLDGRYEYAAVDGKTIVYCEGGGQRANESCAVPDLLP